MIGLMSLDPFDLLVLCESDPQELEPDEQELFIQEQKNANKLMPIVQDRHRLLVTLLTMNAMCAEALPIFLDQLVSPASAVLLSVTFVLLFGEILPSAVFKGPTGMRLSAWLAPLVRFLLFVYAPIAVPLGAILDWWIGVEEAETYSKPELKSLLRLHASQSGIKSLTVSQSRMMEGAMDLIQVKAEDAMCGLDKMFMMSADQVLDVSTMAQLVGLGYSRIPVHEPGNRHHIMGILLAKSLMLISPQENRTAGSIGLRFPPCVPPTQSLYDVLEMLQRTQSHFCIVTNQPFNLAKDMRERLAGSKVLDDDEHSPQVLGCVTVTDIMSRVVNKPIENEYSTRRGLRSLAETGELASVSLEEEKVKSQGDSEPLLFRSKWAQDKILQWAERARLATKLSKELDKMHAESQQAKYESTPLLFPNLPRIGTESEASRARVLARKMTSDWILKKTFRPHTKKELLEDMAVLHRNEEDSRV